MREASLDVGLESLRTELTGYCYRMLGSGFEAEDAVQEALARAWRSRERYDARRGSLRTWVYRIATNICLDMLRSPQRRARAIDLGDAATGGADLGPPLPEQRWVQPVPDALVLPTHAGPEETALRRETVRLALVAALQRLPARQRAVLILRDVLCWRAEEVADLLDVSVAAVNSALQRARATLRAADLTAGDVLRPTDAAQRDLLARYCDAFARHDVTALVALLHEDATMSMPPFAWRLCGRDRIAEAWRDPRGPCAGARLTPTAANGTPAFWQTRPGPDGRHTPFALVLLDLAGDRVRGITTYLDADRLWPLFVRAGAAVAVPSEVART
ncbi:RNA polymerase subunit sigma-70 [Micromonospora coxensis]|uniref:RNA polymerase subunit sigma-70 n=1 Tax=Micromonospora coxensis TaxID=356852 RepID=UPI00343C33F7